MAPSNGDSSSYKDRIVQDPQICGGAPVFKGTRVTLRTVLASLAAGNSPDDILGGDCLCCSFSRGRLAGAESSAHSMKLKLDENIPLQARAPLEGLGHDVHTTQDEGLGEHLMRTSGARRSARPGCWSRRTSITPMSADLHLAHTLEFCSSGFASPPRTTLRKGLWKSFKLRIPKIGRDVWWSQRSAKCASLDPRQSETSPSARANTGRARARPG